MQELSQCRFASPLVSGYNHLLLTLKAVDSLHYNIIIHGVFCFMILIMTSQVNTCIYIIIIVYDINKLVPRICSLPAVRSCQVERGLVQ